MRKFVVGLFLITCLVSGAFFMTNNSTHAQGFGSFSGPDSFAELVDDLLPAVVNISSTQKMGEMGEMPDLPQFPPGSPFEDFFEEFFERRGGPSSPAIPPASLGSGFIIDAEKGYIVTNNHVIRDADEVRVTFHDDETIAAEVIGRDEKTDLAVLQVKTDKELTAVKFGESDRLRVGDWVVAIGNPFGLGGTVTAGIVSARQRDINSGPYDDFIQTDASINRGNSGGPMFDMIGRVIGINTAIFSPSGGSVGIGFAIPSALAKPVIDQIIKYGRTRRGWLGVRIQTVNEEIAESLGLKEAQGALVASLTPEGPAEAAGIQAGDVILRFNGEDVEAMRQLPRIVAETDIDTKVGVELWREGKIVKVDVEIGELEKAEEEGLIASTTMSEEDTAMGKGTDIEPLGLKLQALNDSLRDEFALSDDVQGLIITDVSETGDAAVKGLLQGDVIVEINQTPVTKTTQAEEIIAKAVKQDRNSVLLLVNRSGDARFVALRLEKPSEEEEEKEKSDKKKD